MRVIKTMTSPLTVWTLLCIVVVSASGVWAQEGGGGGDDGKPRMQVSVFAKNGGSADLAVFMLDGQLWRPPIAKDSSGTHLFQVRPGFFGPLSLYPIDAIDDDDGSVSLYWKIWSDDPVLLNGAVHTLASPITGGWGVQPQSWSVETPPALELQELTFSGMPAPVVQDDGSAYPLPHWQQSDDSDYVPSPVMYVRGDTMEVTVTFQTIPNDGGGTLYVKGDGPGNLDFGPVDVSVSGGTVTLPLTCANAFADQVEFFDPLDIAWSYGFTSSGPWKEAGTSENLLYVTLGTPLTTAYHTLIHLGCDAAQGISGEKTQADPLVLAAIWNKRFAAKEVRRILPNGTEAERFLYYGKYQNRLVNTTAGLLQTGDGMCVAWSSFFLDMLKIQGLSYENELHNIIHVYEPDPTKGRFLVSTWLFDEGGGTYPSQDYPYRNQKKDGQYIQLNANSNAIPNYEYIWESADVHDRDGLDGQGKNPNPESLFMKHVNVRIHDTIYDPSYGKQFSTVEDMDEIIAGYGFLTPGGGGYFFKPNDPSDHVLELESYLEDY